MDCPFIRYAIVRGARGTSEVGAYLPSNYEVLTPEPLDWPAYDGAAYTSPAWVISGRDDAGWTLHGYVEPRFASGLISCIEIDLSHPIMKKIPA